ncbi:WecB/TagA/CpsF family glycosyltransferase [Acaryochloris marina]|uniref:WecB/TagA/CpsF family glycosyltransferase n=1 Tax=Acaryochloris marina TaxID=155978 RepID=UPI0011D13A72|nr:WecB/TagA/CpsF family glycosyltransferase [Acaryochloris marina]
MLIALLVESATAFIPSSQVASLPTFYLKESMEMLAKDPNSELFSTDIEPLRIDVIGSLITAAPIDVLVNVILVWAKQHKSKMVCIANTHMLVDAHQKPSFGEVLKDSDIVTPNAMPLVWLLKRMGVKTQEIVTSLNLMQCLCQKASQQKVSIFFLGSQSLILQKMRHRLAQDFPELLIAGMEPLPIRPLTLDQRQKLIQRIKHSGAGLVMVAYSSPKQEYWMAEHKNQIEAVMIGVGGAFPAYAGLNSSVPTWMKEIGFEWIYRFFQEPTKFWKKHVKTTSIFIHLALNQIWNRYFELR